MMTDTLSMFCHIGKSPKRIWISFQKLYLKFSLLKENFQETLSISFVISNSLKKGLIINISFWKRSTLVLFFLWYVRQALLYLYLRKKIVNPIMTKYCAKWVDQYKDKSVTLVRILFKKFLENLFNIFFELV